MEQRFVTHNDIAILGFVAPHRLFSEGQSITNSKVQDQKMQRGRETPVYPQT